ncbi:MAG: hypothetical protein EAZ42_01445 [Verrucomicrobia bacterium]|nr:MAG: hypothetical protein EAZ42_01445 [Verrucomicrobiota bacterium]
MKNIFLISLFLTAPIHAELVFTLRHQEGLLERETRYLFQKSSLSIAEIAQEGASGPLPAKNVFDFEKNFVRILWPINQLYEEIPLEKLVRPSSRPGELPTLPEMPAAPGAATGMPAMMPPPLAGELQKEPEFSATEEKKMWHGFECKKFIFSSNHLELVVWAVPQAKLPPFYLRVEQKPSRNGISEVFDDWPRLLREKSLFPFHVTLQEAERPDFREDDPPVPAQPIASWEIKSIEARELSEEEKLIFNIPTDYLNITKD